VLGIINIEIVKVTDENVQKEIDINTEVLGIVNGKIQSILKSSFTVRKLKSLRFLQLHKNDTTIHKEKC
jgi:hypothetical protein